MSLLFKTASSMNQEFKFHQLLYKPTAHISQFRQILGEFQCNGYTPTREFPWWLRWWWICLQCRAYINTVIRRMPAHVLFVSDCDPMDHSPQGSSVYGILQAITGVGCHALLQGTFLTQGLNPSLLPILHWQVGCLPLAPPGKQNRRDNSQKVKNPPAIGRPGFNPWVRKIPWRRKWQSTPVLLPREFHGQRTSILAWRIQRTEQFGGLQSMGLQRVGHNWATNTLILMQKLNRSDI